MEKRSRYGLIVGLVGAAATVIAAIIGIAPDLDIQWEDFGPRGECNGLPPKAWADIGDNEWIPGSGSNRYQGELGEFGLRLAGHTYRRGRLETIAHLQSGSPSCLVGIAFDYDRKTGAFKYIGIEGNFYVFGSYDPLNLWSRHRTRKRGGVLPEDSRTPLALSLEEENATFFVNGTAIFEIAFLLEAASPQGGLLVKGCKDAEFICTAFCSD